MGPQRGPGRNPRGELIWAHGHHIPPTRVHHYAIIVSAIVLQQLSANIPWCADYLPIKVLPALVCAIRRTHQPQAITLATAAFWSHSYFLILDD